METKFTGLSIPVSYWQRSLSEQAETSVPLCWKHRAVCVGQGLEVDTEEADWFFKR